MKFTVKQPTIIEDGLHRGIITAVQPRDTTEGYHYLDIIIEMAESITMKSSYPATMMEESKLGQLMKRFGAVVAVNLEVDTGMLVGKHVSFMTLQRPGKKGGVFANILPESLKPTTKPPMQAPQNMIEQQPDTT